MPAYKHLFFDLDHTLWDFDLNAKHALTDLFANFDLEKRIPVPFVEFYEKYIYHNELLWSRYQKGFITAEELKWKRMWRTLLEFKIADEPMAREISSKFLEILPTKTNVFPHTFEILNYLKARDYRMHLITNGFEKTQWSKITNCGIDKFFSHVITSESSNSLKPKKEIFDYALAKTGAVLSESIMIGDNIDADIQGAINAGMDSIFVNHIGAVHNNIHPTFTVSHLRELEDIL